MTRNTPCVLAFVLAGVLGVVLAVVLGYTSGSLIAYVAALKRQRRVRSLFRQIACRRQPAS